MQSKNIILMRMEDSQLADDRMTTTRFTRGAEIILVSYAIVLSTYLLILFPTDVILSLTVEDGLIENIGAMSFLLASGVFFAVYAYSSGLENRLGGLRTQRNMFYLLLGIIFLICFGEEVSWGQRAFYWMTPEWLKEINLQGETNLHNIALFHGKKVDGTQKSGLDMLLNMNRLFSLFWLGFCVVVPVAYKFSRKMSGWCDWVGLPIVPLWIGGLFLAHALLFQLVYESLAHADSSVRDGINELKESNYAVLFLFLALWELKRIVLCRRQ